MSHLGRALTVALAAGFALAPSGGTPSPTYARVHALSPREGVFAYARISPDGKKLVYASEEDITAPSGLGYVEVVVDIEKDSVVLTDPGIDAYWSLDGERLIYGRQGAVIVRNLATGSVTRQRAPARLGDYYSWAKRDGRDLILTIASNYYYLRGDTAVLPHARVAPCLATNGTGERPLISKDGRRITTFVRGNIVVRGLDNCDDVIDTHTQGAKADFSWDGRYIAFHAVRSDGAGCEIRIFDLESRTLRTLKGLEGSALFPSWTEDGRLCFRYDGPDYRGFIVASNVLDAVPERVDDTAPLTASRTWADVFPRTPSRDGVQLVMIWAPWSVHSRDAFAWLREARASFAPTRPDISVMAASDPSSDERDVIRMLAEFGGSMARISLDFRGLLQTEARNQMPATLLFRNGRLIDQRLGAQTARQLREWVGQSAPPLGAGR